MQVFLIILFLIINKTTHIPPITWFGFPLKFLFKDPTSSGCSVLLLLPLAIDIGFCGLLTYLVSKLLWITVKIQ